MRQGPIRGAGSYLGTIAEAMGMVVLKTSSRSSREDFERLLKEAHVISIHCPLTPATSGLIGRAELAMMQPGVLIVNYGRGPVIDKEVRLFQGEFPYVMLCDVMTLLV
jgi:glycerate dehydrogenase